MRKDLLLYATLMIPLVQYALDIGLSPDFLQDEFQIDAENIDVSRFRMTPDQYKRLIYHLKEITGNSHIGIHAARKISIEHCGIVGYVMMNCMKFKEAFEKYILYRRITGNATNMVVEHEKGRIKCSWTDVYSELQDIKQVTDEGNISSMLSIYRQLTTQDLNLEQVFFDFPRPDDPTVYEKEYNAVINFNQLWTGVYICEDCLDTPIRTPNSNLLPVFESHARACIGELTSNRQYSNEVIRLLSNHSSMMPNLNGVSRELNMSSKSLQIKLRNEGTSYRELKNDVLCEMAKNYLNSRKYTAAEVAYLLGYSDPGVFHRVFKRWTGMTTSEFRSIS